MVLLLWSTALVHAGSSSPAFAQAETDPCAPGSGDGTPEPWEPGDPYCEAPESVQVEDSGAGAPGPMPDEQPAEDDGAMTANAVGPGAPDETYRHWVGIQTSSFYTSGVIAAMTVVDPAIAHPSNDFVAQRLLVKNCDSTRWLSAGWIEAGDLGSYTQQYPFIRDSGGGFAIYVPDWIRSGDTFHIMLRPTGNGNMWGAFINTASMAWTLIHEFDMGTLSACGTEAMVQIDGASTAKNISFPNIRWGYGPDSGVTVRRPGSQQMEPWNTSIPTSEANSPPSAPSTYNTSYVARYYDWTVNYNAPAPPNQPPVVKIAVSPTSGTRSTVFKANLGASYDPEGNALGSLQIDWGDGTFSYPASTTADQSHQYPNVGGYWVRGYACDSKGACAYSDRQLVNVGNAAPVAVLNTTPASGNTSTSFSANLSGTNDPDGGTLSLRVDWGDGTSSYPSTTTQNVTHFYPRPGTFTITGVACDQTTCSTSAGRTAQVANRGPVTVLNLTPASGDRSTVFRASLAGTYDPDGESIGSGLRIDWGDGTFSFPSYLTHEVNHTYSSAGTYTVKGRTCDWYGACTEATKLAQVAFSNRAPTARMTVTPGQGDPTTTFSASLGTSTDPDRDTITGYEIDWGDGTSTFGKDGAHRYTAPGDYTVTGIVTDSWGAASSTTKTVRVCFGCATTPTLGPGDPVAVRFDDQHLDLPLEHYGYHNFTVLNSAGESVRNTALGWIATVSGVNGPLEFTGRLDQNGRAGFDYTGNKQGLDTLRVVVNTAVGTATRSYGTGTAPTPPTIPPDPCAITCVEQIPKAAQSSVDYEVHQIFEPGGGNWNGFKVYLSPGHFSYAQNEFPCGASSEWEEAWETGRLARDQLVALNYKVMMPKKNEDVGYTARVATAYDWWEDKNKKFAYVAIHSNAGHGSGKCGHNHSGTQLLYENAKDHALGAKIFSRMAPQTPGTKSEHEEKRGPEYCSWEGYVSPWELCSTSALEMGTAYMEVEWHDTNQGADWVRNNNGNAGASIAFGTDCWMADAGGGCA
ncbi:MAG TPA: PKD domain-containing protein [Actinomycetota bacterium]|nr:PKD domain-containing protein [Actinomycetota bacterium]